jgi:hypothetical protein
MPWGHSSPARNGGCRAQHGTKQREQRCFVLAGYRAPDTRSLCVSVPRRQSLFRPVLTRVLNTAVLEGSRGGASG